MLLALLLCTGSNCTGDPPGITNVRLAVNRSGVRAGFTLVDFKIQSVQVFYDDAPPPMPTNAGLAEDCSFAPAELAAENLGLASLDLTEKGLTGIGSFQTRFGKVTEIRLVIDQAALIREGSRGELKGQLACKADAQPSRREVLRLIPAAPIQLAATTVTLAVDFDPNRDVFTGEVGAQDGSQGQGVAGAGANGNGPSDKLLPSRPGLRLAGTYALSAIPFDSDLVLPDQIIVRFNDFATSSFILTTIQDHDATILAEWRPSGEYLLKLPGGSDLGSEIRSFERLPQVSFAIPNLRVRLPQLPNDPGFAQQTPWQQIRAERAWDRSTGDPRTVVAIVDTGFDLTHPDLIDNWFINVHEIPDFILAGVSDRNGNGLHDPLDLDVDGDGVVTFRDLNDARNDGVCPKANHAPTDRCDPLDLVDGSGRQNHLDRTNVPEACTTSPSAGYGWQDNVDADCNGLIDDIVGWDFGTGTNRPSTPPTLPLNADPTHGTKSAGVVGAIGNNSVALAGVNWRVRILPIRAYTSGDVEAGADEGGHMRPVLGMRYAERMGAEVTLIEAFFVVASEGASNIPPCSGTLPNIPESKFNELRSRLGVQFGLGEPRKTLVVTPAGNCNVNIDRDDLYEWPAGFNDNGLRVTGALADDTPDNRLAFGTKRVDLAAPSRPEFVALSADGGTGTTFSGSSAASAFVAGASALTISADRSLAGHPCPLADRLIRNATIVPALADAGVASGRRLDLASAVENAVTAPVRACP